MPGWWQKPPHGARAAPLPEPRPPRGPRDHNRRDLPKGRFPLSAGPPAGRTPGNGRPDPGPRSTGAVPGVSRGGGGRGRAGVPQRAARSRAPSPDRPRAVPGDRPGRGAVAGGGGPGRRADGDLRAGRRAVRDGPHAAGDEQEEPGRLRQGARPGRARSPGLHRGAAPAARHLAESRGGPLISEVPTVPAAGLYRRAPPDRPVNRRGRAAAGGGRARRGRARAGEDGAGRPAAGHPERTAAHPASGH